MTTPVRLRLSRLRGFDLQAHSRAINGLPAVNVARPTKWGNSYEVGDEVVTYDAAGRRRRRAEPMTAEEAVERYRRMHCLASDSARIIRELRGKNLACWCAPGAPCHADVLLELANRPICEAAE